MVWPNVAAWQERMPQCGHLGIGWPGDRVPRGSHEANPGSVFVPGAMGALIAIGFGLGGAIGIYALAGAGPSPPVDTFDCCKTAFCKAVRLVPQRNPGHQGSDAGQCFDQPSVRSAGSECPRYPWP